MINLICLVTMLMLHTTTGSKHKLPVYIRGVFNLNELNQHQDNNMDKQLHPCKTVRSNNSLTYPLTSTLFS